MPKYGGNPARRRTRRHIIVITLIVALLGGGGAVAYALQPDEPTSTVADDTLSAARQIGAPEPKPTRHQYWKRGWHRTPKPTATPTPTPTQEPTEEPQPEPTQSEEPEETQVPEPEPPAEDVDYGDFPTMETTGPRTSDFTQSDSLSSEENGQVIEGLEVSGRIQIEHDDVVLRDVRINHVAQENGQYALHITEKSNGECPRNVVIEHIEIAGDTDVLDDRAKSFYSECPFTMTNSRVYDVGTGLRFTNGAHIEGNFIRANHYNPDSGTHRSGMGMNGGADHVIVNNTIECEGPGCSGAFVMYGDFAQVSNVLVEHNLFNTTGSYCTYAGSLDSKEFPVAENVRYIDNHFGRKFFDTCGRYGPAAGRDSNGGPGFVWEGNVWADTGEPVE
ncbi:right-handed parallel beta-helix repeat-containing protein [Jiangella sp. DSM 45060]|uniref:right-handed parallel beta-helix repeat-containing protein n=1 Tax=Jiangella sp. DSM 45060 TaxID=1798224 RepID=UPI00087C592A|nr:right-handed parallel beta-helix repeat-containing protein [Jiangella sp. DSM 45060]SDT58821.1 Right handed beta helix region [Jiangella sp. DSM 45060]